MDPSRARPLLVAVTNNLMDQSRFEAAGASVGYHVEFVRSAAVGTVDPVVAFVDLEAPGADGAISNLAGRGFRVIAYGPHVDDLGMVRAHALGGAAAEHRNRVLTNLAEFLPPVV